MEVGGKDELCMGLVVIISMAVDNISSWGRREIMASILMSFDL